MAQGKYEKAGSGKGGLVLLLIITILVIGGCVAGILYIINRDGPDGDRKESTKNLQVQDRNDGSDEIPEPEGSTPVILPPAPSEATDPTVETTVPVEETTAPTEETTVPTEPETVPTQPIPEGGSSVGTQVAQTALAQLGKPYKSGGNGPDNFDTTGFVYYCLKENNLATKRQKLKQLVQEGMEVPREELQPGDVVFFRTNYEPGVQYTASDVEYAGIYIGNNKFVAARNEKYPVSELDMTVDYFDVRYITARRFGD